LVYPQKPLPIEKKFENLIESQKGEDR